VKQRPDGSPPSASWKAADGVSHYDVVVFNESYNEELVRRQVQVPASGKDPHWVMAIPRADTTCRLEVSAVTQGFSGEPAKAIFYIPTKLRPDSEEAKEQGKKARSLLLDSFDRFLEKVGRCPRVLIVGLLSQGKSSLCNHTVRCLKETLDIPDEAEAGPPKDTTIYTELFRAECAECKRSFTFCDAPALPVVDADGKKDLQNWLWSMAARQKRKGWRRLFAWPPDAVIIVVSLMKWLQERDALRDYLKELAELLRSSQYPYVLVLAHEDAFFEEVGSRCESPLQRRDEAMTDFKGMANTDYVFSWGNYKEGSWWQPATTESTFRMLRTLCSISMEKAKHRKEKANKYNCFIAAVCMSLLIVVLSIVIKSWQLRLVVA